MPLYLLEFPSAASSREALGPLFGTSHAGCTHPAGR